MEKNEIDLAQVIKCIERIEELIRELQNGLEEYHRKVMRLLLSQDTVGSHSQRSSIYIREE
jgi:exonuclease VII small subunit